MSSFGPIAPYYDALMRSIPYRMWVSYYLLVLAQQGVRPKTILDVCCGTGVMAEMLVREGFQLSGIDLSEPMIAEAMRKAAKRRLNIEYTVANASTFQLNQRFDAAFSFFDSLNNITEPEAFRSALRQVADHLKPGGSFVFDLNTAYAFEQRMFDQEDTKATHGLRYWWRGDYDPQTRLIEVYMRFWFDDREFEEVHHQRAYEIDDVRTWLEDAGFECVTVYDAYTLNRPRAKSDRVHFAALMPQ